MYMAYRLKMGRRHSVPIRKIHDMDQRMRINYTSPRTINIEANIKSVIDDLVNGIAHLENRFELVLHPVGSFYEKNKIGQPNEFDYTLEIKPRGVIVNVDNLHYFKKETIDCDIISFDGRSNQNTPIKNVTTLSTYDICHIFKHHIDKLMSRLRLPSCLVHGGHDRSSFSGYVKNGPAFMLQFVYIGKASSEELPITVDLTLALSISKDNPGFTSLLKSITHRDFLASILYELGHLKQFWLLPTATGGIWKCSITKAENDWFDTFAERSTPKTALRICKGLLAETGPVRKENLTMSSTARRDVDFLEMFFRNKQRDSGYFPVSHQLTQHPDACLIQIMYLGDRDSKHTFGEVGPLKIFQSYLFKRILLTIMAMDLRLYGSKGDVTHHQDRHDVADMVFRVLSFLFDLVEHCYPKSAPSTPPGEPAHPVVGVAPESRAVQDTAGIGEHRASASIGSSLFRTVASTSLSDHLNFQPCSPIIEDQRVFLHTVGPHIYYNMHLYPCLSRYLVKAKRFEKHLLYSVLCRMVFRLIKMVGTSKRQRQISV